MQYRMHTGISKLLFTSATAVLGLALAGTAQAQGAAPTATAEPPDEASGPDDIVDIIVTGSRVVRDGYDQPTPVTVIGGDYLAKLGQPNIFSAVNQLPSLSAGTSPQNNNGTVSNAARGLSSFDLRALGPNRTLVLLDGQRVVGSTLDGVVDVSALPQGLIERVEVVTGGASASWGSDAVAGVVNFITNKRFEGLKGEISGGVTTYGDNGQQRITLTQGHSFLDNRAHFVISGEYFHNAGVKGSHRPWYRGTKVLQRSIADTPPGEPQYLAREHVGIINATPGGIVTAGSLTGTAFGDGGVPYAFQYGSETGGIYTAGGQADSDAATAHDADARLTRSTIYSRLSYDLTDNMTVWAAGSYARVHTSLHSDYQYKLGNITIQRDNAFLPESVRAQMVALDLPSLTVGSYNRDIGRMYVNNVRAMKRFTAGLDGDLDILGTNWKLTSYLAYARNDIRNELSNLIINPLYNLALDAVRAPSGQIVCRSTLANPTNGCVPLNVLGTGVASRAAVDYVTGQSSLRTRQSQIAGSIALSGEPFSSWAGPVSIAYGVEYRREKFRSVADSVSEGNGGGNPLLRASGNNFYAGNFHGSRGSYDVVEGFLEAVFPLLDSSSLGKADLNGGVRATDYSTAGYVTTWKVGGTYAPIEDIKFRGTLSRDIRAPNLNELFRAPLVFLDAVVDRGGPFDGQSTQIVSPTVGNPNLKPEMADTFEAGVVLRPSFIPKLHASVDFYRIKIRDGISSLSAQNVVDLCFQGNQALCAEIDRDASGRLTSVTSRGFNVATQLQKGIDIELDYSIPLPSDLGRIDLRNLATHVITSRQDSGIPNSPIREFAGQSAQDTRSIPHWRILAMQSYRSNDDRFGLTLTERWISGGKVDNRWIECQTNCPLPTVNNPTVDNNHVKSVLYFDLYMSAKTGREAKGPEFYLKIDNLFNKAPPAVYDDFLIFTGSNPGLYDNIGRTFRIGARFQF